MEIWSAPLQGYTEAHWRGAHSKVYGRAVSRYFSPFLRLEKGELRHKDLRDISSEMNEEVPLTPQIIFRDAAEFRTLVDTLKSLGYSSVDLNLGCPFPPQMKKGRGCGLLRHPEVLAEIASLMRGEYSDIAFSVKMRLGVEDPDEWHEIIGIINDMPLTHLAVHPRVGRQQYGGELYTDRFEAIHEATPHTLVYNGDVTTVAQIRDLEGRYPWLGAVMIGRGLLACPSLAAEYAAGREYDAPKRLEMLCRMHAIVYDYCTTNLCGDTQILSKLKPFWEYLEPFIGHRAHKLIHKATTLPRYLDALATFMP